MLPCQLSVGIGGETDDMTTETRTIIAPKTKRSERTADGWNHGKLFAIATNRPGAFPSTQQESLVKAHSIDI